jgi:sulfur carrier protein
MKITLNGQPFTLEENTSIEQLIQQLGLAEKRYAVEVNESIVPRSEHTESHLQAGDKVEIIQAIGGG